MICIYPGENQNCKSDMLQEGKKCTIHYSILDRLHCYTNPMGIEATLFVSNEIKTLDPKVRAIFKIFSRGIFNLMGNIGLKFRFFGMKS